MSSPEGAAIDPAAAAAAAAAAATRIFREIFDSLRQSGLSPNEAAAKAIEISRGVTRSRGSGSVEDASGAAEKVDLGSTGQSLLNQALAPIPAAPAAPGAAKDAAQPSVAPEPSHHSIGSGEESTKSEGATHNFEFKSVSFVSRTGDKPAAVSSSKRPHPATSEPRSCAHVQKQQKEEPVFSLSTVESVVEQCKKDGKDTAMTRLIYDIFFDEDKLNSSFIARKSGEGGKESENASLGNPSIDLPELQKAYSLIVSSSSPVVKSLMNATSNMLDALIHKVSANASLMVEPKALRFVIIVSENPLLLSPEHTGVMTKLCRVVAHMRPEARKVIASWLIPLGEAYCRSLVKKIHQAITLGIFGGERIADGIDALTIFLGLVHEANRQYSDDTGAPMLARDMFFNDAVNQEIDLSDDFHKFFYLRKRLRAEKANNSGESKSSTLDLDKYVVPSDLMLQDFTFCACNFILNTAVKAEVLRADARVEQKIRQISVVRQQGQFTTSRDLYLVLEVQRSNIIQSTMQALAGIVSSADLKKPLKIRFLGERGVDEGGVKKEFFQVILRELFDPNYAMFTFHNKSRLYYFNPDTMEAGIEFELIGILLGLAIYNSVILDVHFPGALYHRLLGRDMTLEHLKDFQPQMYKSFVQLLECEDASAAGLTFEVTRSSFGELVTEELKEGGAETSVTNDNREEFVHLWIDYMLCKSVAEPFNAFARGFRKVCDSKIFEWFHPDEIELLICGNPKLDFDELRRTATYEGYSKDHRIVSEFWEIVGSMDSEQQKKLLCFATGSSRAPIKGLGGLNIVIARAGPDSDQLPTSHTCFNHLLLPEYSSKEKLRERLMIAIMNAEGFGLL